jgi:glycerophosphoryl diester phosphodiesterase
MVECIHKQTLISRSGLKCAMRCLAVVLVWGVSQVSILAVEIVAHRGESASAPENTLASIRMAWEGGADAVEFDVHLTKDGQAIVIHDKDTKRTTGIKKVVKQSTLEELRKLDAGSWKDTRWSSERLPTLDEALAATPQKGRCFIEIKVGPESIPAVSKAIADAGKPREQFAIISFNAATIAEAKRQMPDIEAYWLCGFDRDKKTGKWRPSIEEVIKKAKSINADGVDLAAKGLLDQDAVKRIHDEGLKLYVYTVNNPDRARQLADWGVDGITTDKASWLKAKLAQP